jgi:hypothetical protein
MRPRRFACFLARRDPKLETLHCYDLFLRRLSRLLAVLLRVARGFLILETFYNRYSIVVFPAFCKPKITILKLFLLLENKSTTFEIKKPIKIILLKYLFQFNKFYSMNATSSPIARKIANGERLPLTFVSLNLKSLKLICKDSVKYS